MSSSAKSNRWQTGRSTFSNNVMTDSSVAVMHKKTRKNSIETRINEKNLFETFLMLLQMIVFFYCYSLC